jgi:glycosyltransferase involved in cell wall biosynthesis
MSRIAAMHLVDSLEIGGTERMAVNLVNSLPRDQYDPYLCTTRREGPLAELVEPHVGRLQLGRKHTLDGSAIRKLVNFNREHGIRILHAHSSALFVAVAASRFPPRPAVIWHDHFGRFEVEQRPVLLFRLFVRNTGAVISVTEQLAEWARNQLKAPPGKVWRIPNFVSPAPEDGPTDSLPGEPGHRIVCVANLRPQKDHLTLLRAMALVVRRRPAAHLLLVGAAKDKSYLDLVNQEIVRLGLASSVSLLGERQDVPWLLRACDVGTLSSASEGLPLSIIEYGMAALPVVSTEVGQCAEALDFGRAGVLTPPAAPEQFAAALLSVLESPDRGTGMGGRLKGRMQQLHSPLAVVKQICAVYEIVLRHASPEVNQNAN